MEADAPTTTPTHSDDCECGPCNDAENAKAMPTTTPTPRPGTNHIPETGQMKSSTTTPTPVAKPSCDYLDGRRDGYASAIRDVLAEMDEPRREITECEHGDEGVWGCPWCLRMNFAGWLEANDA